MRSGGMIYYAHPVSEYRTEVERMRLDFLSELFPEILNPADPIHEERYRAEGWDYFDRLVETCDRCVFTLFPDGSLGAGVAKEVTSFFDRNLPVYHLKGFRTLRRVRHLETSPMSIDDTRAAVRRFKV